MSINDSVTISHATGVTRPSPQILRVLPPARVPIAWGYVLAFLAVMTITGIQFGRAAPAFELVWGLVFAGIGGTAVLSLALQRRKCRVFNKRRADFLARFPNAIDDVDIWKSLKSACELTPFLRPKPLSTTVLGDMSEDADGALVLCAGLIDVPEATREPFEPEIFTPSRHQMGSIIFGIGICAGGTWLARLAWIGEFSVTAGNIEVGVFIAFGMIGWAIAGARALVFRSTYVRLAPGVIQFVSFGLMNRKPQIRSYPIEAGTIVIVSQFGWLERRFYISRGNHADAISLSGMLRAERGLTWLWRAMLSTAPTSPLSDEELLG